MLQTSVTFLTTVLSMLYIFSTFSSLFIDLEKSCDVNTNDPDSHVRESKHCAFIYFVAEGENQSEKFNCLQVSGQLPNFSSSRLCYGDPSSKLALKLLPEYSQAPSWLCSVGAQMLSTNRVPGGLQTFFPSGVGSSAP